MSKPRLSTGRIPFQLGISADFQPDTLTPETDLTIYDTATPSTAYSSGTVEPPETIYDD